MDKYPALNKALETVVLGGIPIPPDLIKSLKEMGVEVKAQLNYQATIYNATGRWMRDLFQGGYGYTAGDWAIDFEAAIQTYLTEAWMEGMAENELTADDMLPEWQEKLTAIIDNEKAQLPGLSTWLTKVTYGIRDLEEAWPSIHARLDMWANRWLDVFNQAKLATAETEDKMEWVLGATEKHCWVCRQLNGKVAYVREWEEAGFHPQAPPNERLSMVNSNGEKGCGGWKCDCGFKPTDRRRTKNILNYLYEMAQEGGFNL